MAGSFEKRYKPCAQSKFLQVLEVTRDLGWHDDGQIPLLHVDARRRRQIMVTKAQLTRPGHPWPIPKDLLAWLGIPTGKIRCLGTRTHQRHVTGDYVPELR
jgi:hypothetical protein